jgi:hypothetical protein
MNDNKIVCMLEQVGALLKNETVELRAAVRWQTFKLFF